jgi:hypothetical protein
MCEWKRVYKMDEDGCSLITFFKNVKDYDNTILVIKDEMGWVFGAYCTDSWKQTYSFYGEGDNMLFSFEDTDEPTVYYWTGAGDQHMYATPN